LNLSSKHAGSTSALSVADSFAWLSADEEEEVSAQNQSEEESLPLLPSNNMNTLIVALIVVSVMLFGVIKGSFYGVGSHVWFLLGIVVGVGPILLKKTVAIPVAQYVSGLDGPVITFVIAVVVRWLWEALVPEGTFPIILKLSTLAVVASIGFGGKIL